jgi:hypothetical protein
MLVFGGVDSANQGIAETKLRKYISYDESVIDLVKSQYKPDNRTFTLLLGP